MKIIGKKYLAIPEIKVVTYGRFHDDRGYFTETYRKEEFEQMDFVQMNESFSHKNTIRGFHLQWNPYQGKLVRCIEGHMIDFAVDVRKDSPTFGKIVGHDMPSNKSKLESDWIWIPPGFAHGVVFLEDSIIEYLCTGVWSPGNEAAISPLAEDIDWSLCEPELEQKYKEILNGNPLITEKDKNGMTLEAWKSSPNANLFLK
jgi:dTDP-4-dehydrorhamnose 3,5-epimerase